MGRHSQFDRMLTKAYLQRVYVVGKQTSYSIAKKVGCSNVTVLNYLRTYDIEIRQGSDAQILDARYSKKNMDRCVALYLSKKPGTSIQALSKKFHLDHKKLSAEFKKRGIFIPPTIYQAVLLNRLHTVQAKKNRAKKNASIYTGVCSYKKYRSLIDSLSRVVKNKKGKVKDHKLSVHDAYYMHYENPPTIFEIAHPCNIEYMPAWENQEKGRKSSITLKELRASITDYNRIHGDPFEASRLTRIRQNLAEIIEKEGGTISSGVSSRTTHLLVATKTSGSDKATKARALGVKIMTADEFKGKFKL